MKVVASCWWLKLYKEPAMPHPREIQKIPIEKIRAELYI